MARRKEIRAPLGPVVEAVAVAAIEPSPHNPRVVREDESLRSLSESIHAQGVIQPIVVRPVPSEDGAERYQIVAGERRWRASRLAEQQLIPAVIREDLSDEQALELTVLENLQREELSPLEEARGVASLVSTGQAIELIADRLGKPVRWVARRAQLVNLSPAWREALADPESLVHGMSAAQLELVARLPEVSQDRLIADRGPYFDPSWSLGQLRGVIGRALCDVGYAPFPVEDDSLVDGCGGCGTCPKRSSCQPALWDPEDMFEFDGPSARASSDLCLDRGCWDAKLAAHLARRLQSLDAPLALCSDQVADRLLPAGTPRLRPWHVDFVRQGDEGAVAVVVAEEASAYDRRATVGNVVWVRPRAATGAKLAAQATAAQALAAKREALQWRRAKRVLERAADHVAGMAVPPLPTLLVLAAAVGTNYRRSAAGALGGWCEQVDGVSEWKPVKDCDELLQRARLDPVEMLWRGVRRVLVDLIRSPISYGGSSPEVLGLPTLRAFAGELELDVDQLLEEAAAEIREPKAWRKLEERAELERREAAAAAKPRRRRIAIDAPPGEMVAGAA